MKKCEICGKKFEGPSLIDLMLEKDPNFPVMCDECMEINAEIFDERMRKGQPLPRGLGEARAAIIEYKKRKAR
jgi:hypothetical protein